MNKQYKDITKTDKDILFIGDIEKTKGGFGKFPYPLLVSPNNFNNICLFKEYIHSKSELVISCFMDTINLMTLTFQVFRSLINNLMFSEMFNGEFITHEKSRMAFLKSEYIKFISDSKGLFTLYCCFVDKHPELYNPMNVLAGELLFHYESPHRSITFKEFVKECLYKQDISCFKDLKEVFVKENISFRKSLASPYKKLKDFKACF